MSANIRKPRELMGLISVQTAMLVVFLLSCWGISSDMGFWRGVGTLGIICSTIVTSGIWLITLTVRQYSDEISRMVDAKEIRDDIHNISEFAQEMFSGGLKEKIVTKCQVGFNIYNRTDFEFRHWIDSNIYQVFMVGRALQNYEDLVALRNSVLMSTGQGMKEIALHFSLEVDELLEAVGKSEAFKSSDGFATLTKQNESLQFMQCDLSIEDIKDMKALMDSMRPLADTLYKALEQESSKTTVEGAPAKSEKSSEELESEFDSLKKEASKLLWHASRSSKDIKSSPGVAELRNYYNLIKKITLHGESGDSIAVHIDNLENHCAPVRKLLPEVS